MGLSEEHSHGDIYTSAVLARGFSFLFLFYKRMMVQGGKMYTKMLLMDGNREPYSEKQGKPWINIISINDNK